MLRAASWPGQHISRQIIRVLSLPCTTLTSRHHLLHTSDMPSHREQILQPTLPIHLELRPSDSAEWVSARRKEGDKQDPFYEQEAIYEELRPANTSAQTLADWESYFHPAQGAESSTQPETLPQSETDYPTFFKHLNLIHTTHDVLEAWHAYQALAPYLLDASHFAGDEEVLYLCLHRLVRLLAAVEPHTRIVQLRIISVVCTLRNVGARIYGWERRLLKTCAESNNIRGSEIKGAISAIGDILLSQDSKRTLEEVVGGQHDTLRDEIVALLDEPLPDAARLESSVLVPPVGRLLTEDSERARLLNVLGTTQSFSDAWDAYRTLSSLPIQPNTNQQVLNKFPEKNLHRLVSLLATVKPRTRNTYLCLTSILSTMRGHGYRIRLWEWNLLIDCSAKGWRKMRPEDYKAALRVFSDMLNYQGDMLKSGELAPLDPPAGTDIENVTSQENSILVEDLSPDIYTYTTLIAHASRTLYPPTLRHAKSLLKKSNLAPNRITLLAQMRLYTMRNQIFGVRHIIAEMRERGFYLHNDGMNSCLWAFARNRHMDVAEAIYRLLRNNVVPEDPDPSEDGIEATARFLEESENIVVPPRMVPDKVTYTILIQCCAYQGDLTRTLQIFIDMLSSPDPVAIWRGEDGNSARFVPVLPIYRAIFLGFYRHGVDPRRAASATNSRQFSANKTPWNGDNLYAVYKSFLQLPRDQKPGDRVIYWLIMAFAKSTGYDTGKLRKVWKRLEKRFGNNWGLRLQRVRKSIYGNTEHTKAGYQADEGSEDDEDDE